MTPTKALCILDGGQVSTVCAALACQQFDEVHAVICSGKQQNEIEVESAIAVADILKLASRELIDLSLISAKAVPARGGRCDRADLPPGQTEINDITFPSAQNILLLTLAANHAAIKGIKNIFASVCKEDFADGFNLRQNFIDLMAQVLGEGLWRDPAALAIHTPLMDLTRVESIKLAIDVMGDSFQKVFELTHDCSLGVEGGCGQCHPCRNRDRTFEAIGTEDPIWKFRHPEFSSPITQLYKILSKR